MSITMEKSRKFAIRIYNLYKYLCSAKKEYTLAKQLLRSGTSIGANLSEAQYSASKKDFLAKTTISLKECAETELWLDLLKETNIINKNEYDSIIQDCKERVTERGKGAFEGGFWGKKTLTYRRPMLIL